MSKPIHTARAGQVTIRVHRNGPGRYCIAWHPAPSQPRVRETFGARLPAIQRADAIALALANNRAHVLQSFTSADADNYNLALQAVAPLGIPLSTAINEYVAARRLLGAHSLTEAATHFNRQHPASVECPSTAVIVAELLSSLAGRQHRPITRKTVRSLGVRLGHIARELPDLGHATTHEIIRFLESLRSRNSRVAPKTRDHFRDAIRQLLFYAQMRGWLPRGPHPASNIARIWQPSAVTTYTVAEGRALFAAAPPRWLPALALGAFAGLRPSEAWRLRWEFFKWDESLIDVTKETAAKTGLDRYVPILPALAAWLAPFRRDFGPLHPHRTLESFESAISRLARFLEKSIPGFEWKQDCLRHTFVSCRLAITQNEQQVMIEAGHTNLSTQRKYYRNKKTPREAESWFSILPDPSGKILAMAS